MAREFLFYDLETWSLDPPGAYLVEAALQRTDSTFTPIEPQRTYVCKPVPEAVPQPEALLVHGKTPQWAEEQGMTEYALARELHREFNRPGTCLIGYNNLRYDDECTRYLFYRNLLDPYTHQYKNGNSRWDVLELVRLAFALRPELLQWPHGDDDVSLKLELLAGANGIEMDQAHDAISDTNATIALAQKLYLGNPRMVDFAFAQTRTPRLGELAARFLGKVCLHISPRISRAQGHISLVYPVCRNPSIPKQLYAVDLSTPVELLLEESPQQIRELLFTRREELPPDFMPPRVKRIHLNRAPLLLETKLLSGQRAAELGVDVNMCHRRYEKLAAEPSLANKLVEVFGEGDAFPARRDPNYALYDGFVPDTDRRLAERLHQLDQEQWPDVRPDWRDPRMDSLWLRLLGRLMPERLGERQRAAWEQYKAAALGGRISDQAPGVVATMARTQALLAEHPGHQGLLDLRTYLQERRIPE